MTSARALRIAAAFIAGFAAALVAGAAAGLFDRGPVQADLDQARASGRADAAAAVEVRLGPQRAQRIEIAYGRGIRHSEFILMPGLHLLPNSNDWFRGVDAGRRLVQTAVDSAVELGRSLGAERGRADARSPAQPGGD